MIIELKGSTKNNVKAGLDFLREMGIKVERLAARIRRDDEKCFQCGACTAVCSAGALYIKRPEMSVIFDVEKCTGCGFCVRDCPVGAVRLVKKKAVIKESCTDCGACIRVCEPGALVRDEVPASGAV